MYRRFRGAEAIETGIALACGSDDVRNPATNFDISFVDTMIPLHSRMIRPANATATRNRVLVKKTIRARHGGNRDFADFHVVPFGSSIVGKDMSNECQEKRRKVKSSTREDYRMVVARIAC
jgi:hypothetical protein